MNTQTPDTNHEIEVKVQNGWFMLPLLLTMLLGSIALFIYAMNAGMRDSGHPNWPLFTVAVLLFPLSIVLLNGLFTLQPNEARVLILFGEYKGTVRRGGFHWGNPFYSNGPRQVDLAARLAEAQKR